MEAAALKMLSLHLGLVMESADLIGEWRRLSGAVAADRHQAA